MILKNVVTVCLKKINRTFLIIAKKTSEKMIAKSRKK